MHPDCGFSCACYQRAYREAAGMLYGKPVGSLYRTFKLRANGATPAPLPKIAKVSEDPVYQEALAYLRSLGFGVVEAKLKLNATKGTVAERIEQALKYDEQGA